MNMRAYKYELKPTADQKVLLDKTFGCVRFIWNQKVARFNEQAKIGPNRPIESTTEIKKRFEWLNEVSAASLQQKEIDFKEYQKQLFNKKRKSKIGRCSFKHKDSRQSYRLPNQKFKLGNHKLRLEKIGCVDCIVDRRPSKNCKYISVTISKDKTDRYFASVLVQEEINHLPKTGKSVGIDLGLKDFCILSTGQKIENPKWFRESQTKLRKAQKHLSRKQKNSNRFKKCKLKVARLHKKISNQRKHFHHELSTKLIKSFDLIGLENLNIKGLMKNRRLAKSIQDAGWAQFVSFLEYKSVWYGKQVIKVGRFFASSKTCNHCGQKNTNLKLKDREWICTSCGCVNDRDHNAAQNILQESLKIQAQGVA